MAIKNGKDLVIISLESSKNFAQKVDIILQDWKNSNKPYGAKPCKSFLQNGKCVRFGTGEGKGILTETVRGKDVYILVDVCNHSIKYSLFGKENYMSPDDHYQDLKRVIGACNGKAKRITVIMPFLYEGRQHKRNGRESMDCATMLQELANMGVEDIITFDAHDARVQNAIPLCSFDNVMPSLQFIETLCNTIQDINLKEHNKNNTIFISPDEGAIHRSVYFANLLGVDMGMFYKRRDFTKVINGKNPIIAHEYLGPDLEGKDTIVIDDMISSGDSMIDTCKELKKRGAKRVFVFSTFGLFTNGMDKFDKAYEEKLFDKIFTTNLIYTQLETLKREYYQPVEMEYYVAAIIDRLNKNKSIAPIITPDVRIKELLKTYNEK